MTTTTTTNPAALSLTRDHRDWALWWEQLPQPNRKRIDENLDDLAPGNDADTIAGGLSALMLEVFQQSLPPFGLTATGFTPGAQVSAGLDVDPRHDSEGVLDGVDVVASLHVTIDGEHRCQQVKVYVDKPSRELAPPPVEKAGGALAAIIDRAAALISAAMNDSAHFWAASTQSC